MTQYGTIYYSRAAAGPLDTARVSALFLRYLKAQEKALSRAQAEQRMLAKLVNPGLLADISPLISADEADRLNDESINDAFTDVFTNFIG